MRFIFRGVGSSGSDSTVAMGVYFANREPSVVKDQAAISWLTGHPDFEAVPDEPEPEAVFEPVPDKPAPKKAKKARK